MRKWFVASLAVLCLGVLVAQETETTLKVDVDIVNVLFGTGQEGRAYPESHEG